MKSIILAATVLLLFAGCTKQSETEDSPPAAQVPAPKKADQPEKPTVDDSLTALARMYMHSKKICYEPKFDTYFLFYTRQPEGEKPDDGFHGWYILHEVEFVRLSNNTWMLNKDPKDLVVVWPDVTGLTCKDTPPTGMQ